MISDQEKRVVICLKICTFVVSKTTHKYNPLRLVVL